MKRYDFGMPELIVMAVVTGLMGLVLFPRFFQRRRATSINCVNNLKNIGMAYRIFSIDNGNKLPWQIPVTEGGTLSFTNKNDAWRHFAVISNELSTPKILHCRADIGRWDSTSFNSFANSNLSYFCAISVPSSRTTAWLAGDRKLEIGASIPSNAVVVLNPKRAIRWAPGTHASSSSGKGEPRGNIAYADGHVETLTNPQLPAQLARTAPGSATLLFP